MSVWVFVMGMFFGAGGLVVGMVSFWFWQKRRVKSGGVSTNESGSESEEEEEGGYV